MLEMLEENWGISVKKHKTRKYEGLPVVDATKPLELHITKSDVTNSKKGDPGNCAAAVACKREYKAEARVFLSRTYIKKKDHWVRFITPGRISREIISFDRGSSFTPGEYKINPPTNTSKLGAYPNGTTKHKNHQNRNLKKRPHHVTANVRGFDKLHLGKG